jgi:quinol monooxygenase YgiN
VSYGYLGSMKTHPGRRDEVVAILLKDVEELRAAGCDRYIVAVAQTDDVTIWITEVWRSKADHDASLQLPTVRAAIAAAMPMLTGEFTGHDVSVVGGLGV